MEDSNPRPTDYKSAALPAELIRHGNALSPVCLCLFSRQFVKGHGGGGGRIEAVNGARHRRLPSVCRLLRPWRPKGFDNGREDGLRFVISSFNILKIGVWQASLPRRGDESPSYLHFAVFRS